MMENIRRIGIFMIAAQTVMHFAAGKQYEKYMKIITSVIILLLFVTPFVSSSGSSIDDWQSELVRMEQQIQNHMQTETSYGISPAQTVALRQIEEGIRERMNDMISDRDCIVTDVEIVLEEAGEGVGSEEKGAGRSFTFQSVRVILQDKAAEESGEIADIVDIGEERTIRIDEINVGHEPQINENKAYQEAQGLSQSGEIYEYRELFAQALGIAEERVEVTYRGGW